MTGALIFNLLLVIDAGTYNALILLHISAPDAAGTIPGPKPLFISCKAPDHPPQALFFRIQPVTMCFGVFRCPCKDFLLIITVCHYSLFSLYDRPDYLINPVLYLLTEDNNGFLFIIAILHNS